MAGKKGEDSASGSDMSTILATWSYILPSLNYIMRDPLSTSDGRAPVLPVAQHAGIYTVVYNFATASRTGIAGVPGFGMTGATGMRDGFDAEKEAAMDKFERVRAMIGYELYSLLDDYFRDLAREIRLNAPLPVKSTATSVADLSIVPLTKSSIGTSKSKAKTKAITTNDAPLGDELELLGYYTKAYIRFSSGAAQINRLFAYLNRHFIMRAIDEGCGWISLADVVAASVLRELAAVSISSPASTAVTKLKREKSSSNALTGSTKKSKEDLKKLEARKHAEWRKWGYDATLPRETPDDIKFGEQERKIAELCAESASSPERIITCSALAMRSWRLEVADPLLDPAYSNHNGHKDRWVGAAPIPPTPIEFAENKERAKITAPEDEDGPGPSEGSRPPVVTDGTTHATFSVPIAHPSASTSKSPSVPDTPKAEDKGKGKGKSKSSAYYDMSVSIPVSHASPATPIHNSTSRRTLHDSERAVSVHNVNGQSVNGSKKTTTNPPLMESSPVATKKKRPGPRKGGAGSAPQVSLAAVRAATAARAAEKDGDAALSTSMPPRAQTGRLTRAVTFLLEAPVVYDTGSVQSSTGGTDDGSSDHDFAISSGLSSSASTLDLDCITMSAKASYASTVAESLMMCGISPDKTIRRKLDRFLTKVERGDRRFTGTRW
ncbi:hypothetical protein FRB94_006874 [Tulasnella sp. JGI-2019a]|nr:hypothetical protein FRB93_007041 [Tulasnella sp. JGI-2019a]KAG8998447.1 hypothetical protein FRB94_006874 [Tulasnella sp. JGI-2019a]KAG9026336.1 hypothetical protein FRB95_008981 [Tulasnella sp. JGI-2019a]